MLSFLVLFVFNAKLDIFFLSANSNLHFFSISYVFVDKKLFLVAFRNRMDCCFYIVHSFFVLYWYSFR